MIIGLEKPTYSVNEDEGRVEVCVVISNLHTCCPVTHNFSVTLEHVPGSASKRALFLYIQLAYPPLLRM